MTEAIGIAVAGAGGWGKNHVRNFATMAARPGEHPGARLLWVCDLAARAREAAAGAHPGVRATESFAEVLADPAVRGVVVATDAKSHHELAKQALLSGRDVFVEKPLALSDAHALELCELAEKADRILMVGHLLLYHPAVDALKKLIAQGELGEVHYVYSHRLNLGVVRRDENAWWSLAPHDVSVANHLLGAEPESVVSVGGTFLQVERGIEDVAFTTIRYPGGRLAHIHVSWLDPHKTRRLTVVGSKKMAVFDDTSADMKLVLYDKGADPPPTLTYADGVRIRTGDIHIPALRMEEPLRRECEAFVRAVATREQPLASGRSGRAVVRVLEAATASLRAGGAPVPVSAAPKP